MSKTLKTPRHTSCKLYFTHRYHRLAPALFSHFRTREHEAKKEHQSAKKKERERKKREFALFPPTHSGNPVSEPKAAREGESKGLE
jgi:hypothetical protein